MEVLEYFPDFLLGNHMQHIARLLSSSDALTCTDSLKNGSRSQGCTSFFDLLTAYADVAYATIAIPQDPNHELIRQQLLALIECQGIPTVDESISPDLLQFWMNYIDFMQSSSSTLDDNAKLHWVKNANQMMLKAVEAYWRKICWPDGDYALPKDSDNEINFIRFRNDVEDLFQAAFLTFGVDLFRLFQDYANSSYRKNEWAPFGASLFGFNALSDSAAGDYLAAEEVLSEVFSSEIFGDLTAITPYMAAKVKRERLSMLRNYSGFFEGRGQYLPDILNSLFLTLRDPEFAGQASGVILSIGLSCRKSLASMLLPFLEEYKILFTNDNVGEHVLENTTGAISAIIQAFPREEDKGLHLRTLLECIANHHSLGMSLLRTENVRGQYKVLCALRCLASMGKSLQAPDDVSDDTEKLTSSYWSHSYGQSLQRAIIYIIGQTTSVLAQDGDIIEASCQILRTGFNESKPGLFVFAPAVTVEFVRSATLDTAKLSYVFETASMMLAKQAQPPEEDEIQRAAYNILEHARRLTETIDGMQSHNPDFKPD